MTYIKPFPPRACRRYVQYSNSVSLRHRISIICLLFAWLCANGAVWNVVQLVGWAKMFHDNSQVMPAAKALQMTFDGSKPCELCQIVEVAQEKKREQQPHNTDFGGSNRIILALHVNAPLVLHAPDTAWPDFVSETSLTRTEPVPVRPPRV